MMAVRVSIRAHPPHIFDAFLCNYILQLDSDNALSWQGMAVRCNDC